MPFHFRPLSGADLPICLPLHPGRIGHELLGIEKAISLWQSFAGHPAFHARTIEDSATRRIAGYGAAVFVRREFVAAEIARPQPLLNARLLLSIQEGNSPLLSWNEIARDNAAGQLNLVILSSAEDRRNLSPGQCLEVQCALALSFVDLFRGYRMERFLSEAVNADDVALCQSVGPFRLISRYESFFAAHPESAVNRDRGLFRVDHASNAASPGSAAMHCFIHREPKLRFGRLEQELLLAALRDRTDAGIAAALNLSPAAVKRRWARAFEIASAGGLFEASAGPTRGPSKRDLLVDYVKDHPEELRPYLWPDGSSLRARRAAAD